MSELIATYLINDEIDPIKKAEEIALGLTVGSWTNLPSLEKEQLRKHKGRVVSAEASEAGAAIVSIAYPAANFSTDIPAVLTTAFGKLSLDGKIKLLDLNFSEGLKKYFPGPKYGVEGLRKKLNTFNRPLLMSIFKGVLGKDMDFLNRQLREQALGGIDIVKDDEILFENPLTPSQSRVKAGRRILDEVFSETGHRTLYAVNLTGRTFELKEKAKRLAEEGADMLLFNVFTYGLDVLQELREDKGINLPFMAHPSFSGAIASSSVYGVSHSLLLGKLLRYVGADLSLFPSPYGSVALGRESALGIAKELTKDDSIKKAFPVPSAGIHPGLVPLLFSDFGMDSVINAGGGVHGHPGGAAAGGKAFRQAIEAILSGHSLIEAAESQLELQTALSLWGIPKEVTAK